MVCSGSLFWLEVFNCPNEDGLVTTKQCLTYCCPLHNVEHKNVCGAMVRTAISCCWRNKPQNCRISLSNNRCRREWPPCCLDDDDGSTTLTTIKLIRDMITLCQKCPQTAQTTFITNNATNSTVNNHHLIAAATKIKSAMTEALLTLRMKTVMRNDNDITSNHSNNSKVIPQHHNEYCQNYKRQLSCAGTTRLSMDCCCCHCCSCCCYCWWWQCRSCENHSNIEQTTASAKTSKAT